MREPEGTGTVRPDLTHAIPTGHQTASTTGLPSASAPQETDQRQQQWPKTVVRVVE